MQLDNNEVYFDFDIEIDDSEDNNDYRLLLDLPLRNNFKFKTGKAFKEISYLGQKKFKVQDGKKCLLMEPKRIVQQGKYKTSNIISIPSYGNIKTKSGKISLEICPLNINKKQYIFIHNEIQYPSTNISVWIEDGNIYRHDINGIEKLNIKLEVNKWQEIEIEFKGSFYTADNFYISDIQEGIHAYIRNLKVYKK